MLGLLGRSAGQPSCSGRGSASAPSPAPLRPAHAAIPQRCSTSLNRLRSICTMPMRPEIGPRRRLTRMQAAMPSPPEADDGFNDEFDDMGGFLEEDEGGEELEGELLGEDEGGEYDLEEPMSQAEFDKLQGELGYGDDGGQEEARQERLRMAQEAASSGSGPSRYPEPEERGYYLADLFGKAALIDAAELMDHYFPDAAVYGLQVNPDKIIEGDMYVCNIDVSNEDHVRAVPLLVQRALENKAAALLLPSVCVGLEVPEGTPCHYVAEVAEVAERLAVAFYDAPSRDLLVVGVAGGAGRGKTTVSWLVCGMLEAMEQVTGTINSIGYSLCGDLLDIDGDLFVPPDDDVAEKAESSVPFRITPYTPGRYPVVETTPAGLQMHKMLAGMRDRGATCAVVECSTAGLAAGHCRLLEVAVAVHTDLSNLDIEDEEEREAAREAQLQIFDSLVDSSAQAAVINLDDLLAPLVRERTGAMPIVTYSYGNTDADVHVDSAKFTAFESELIVKTPEGRLQIITPLLGRQIARSVLAAVAVGIALKIPLPKIVAGIEAVEVVPGRCEVIDEGQDFSVVVDCADTPEKLEELLLELRHHCDDVKNIWTVFGCRGEEDRSLRVQMTEVADELSDYVILTNDSPRREPPEQIISDLVSGLPEELLNKYSGYVYFPFQDQGHVPLWFEAYLMKAQRLARRYVMEDRFSAIRCAIGTAGPNDVVVIAGRGCRDFMEYWDGEADIVKGWFDDRVEARNALQKLSILQQLDGKLNRSTLPWTTEDDGKSDGLDWDDDDDPSDDDD